MSSTMIAVHPGFGHSGKPYLVDTNAFKLAIVRNLTYFQYHELSPDIKRVQRRKVIVALLHKYASRVFAHTTMAYDGKAILYTSKKLEIDAVANFEVKEAEAAGYESKKAVQVRLSYVAQVDSSDFDSSLRAHHSTTDVSLRQLVNIILRQAAPDVLKIIETKNAIFTNRGLKPLPGGLDLWSGIYATVRPTKAGIVVNCDTTSSVMYRPGNLIDVARTYLQNTDIRRLAFEGHEIEFRKLKTYLKGLLVKQVYAGKKGRVHIIYDLIPNAGNYEFESREGEIQTIREYFLNVHDYPLRYPRLPGVRVKSSDKVVIPFELLEVIEGQMYRRRLHPEVQSKVRQATTRSPRDRLDIISDAVRSFNADTLHSAGVHLSTDPVNFHGRLLSAPEILFGHKNKVVPQNGAWVLSDRAPKTFYRIPFAIKTWSILCFENSADYNAVVMFLKKLLDCMELVGFDTRYLRSIMNSADLPLNMVNSQLTIEQCVRMFNRIRGEHITAKNIKADEHLVIAILPTMNSGEIRRNIKAAGDIECGLITQCVLYDKIRDVRNPYLMNLLLKINTRFGGTNSVPLRGGLEWINVPTMIVGADCSHPSPGVLRPTVAGVVASFDEQACRYFTASSMQEPRLESIRDFGIMMTTLLRKFALYYKDKFLPHRIVVYRDGVSEGEYMTVAKEEIKALKDAIAYTWSNAPKTVQRPLAEDVKVTYIIVTKRHHIRFFPKFGDFSGNCYPGLVADNEDICTPGVFDFYLQAHAGLLGTSRPAHYVALKDENGFTADSLQMLSYALCHSYARATRAVSIPAPVYYAHLVCTRGDIHFALGRKSFDESIDGSADQYDADDWVEAFKPVCDFHSKLMYFI